MAFDSVWDAPAGFHLYRTDWDGDSWIRSVLAATPTENDRAEADLRKSLEGFVREAHADTSGRFRFWVAGLTTNWQGRFVLTTTGSFTFSEASDVDEVAAEWREAQKTAAALRAEVEVHPSRRAPVVVAREVYLARSPKGFQIYREWGTALRNYPRLNVAARLELDTSDLAEFEDLKQFLVDAVRGLHLTPEGVSQ